MALRSSLRFKLIGTFLVLVAIVGTGTLLAIERTLANDLVSSLDVRMTVQGKAVADWLTLAGHPDRLAPRLAAVTGTRITIVGADGLVQGDSLEPSLGRLEHPQHEVEHVHAKVDQRAATAQPGIDEPLAARAGPVGVVEGRRDGLH